jgi:hypothetical protein
VACAEFANADVFATTDDRLLTLAKQTRRLFRYGCSMFWDADTLVKKALGD